MGANGDVLRSYKEDGTTYNPSDGKIHAWPVGVMDDNLQMIAKIAAVCNDASVSQSDNKFVASAMPTEAALKVLVEKMGLPDEHRLSSHGDVLKCCGLWKKTVCRIATLEFDRERKSVGVIFISVRKEIFASEGCSRKEKYLNSVARRFSCKIG